MNAYICHWPEEEFHASCANSAGLTGDETVCQEADGTACFHKDKDTDSEEIWTNTHNGGKLMGNCYGEGVNYWA